MKNREVRVFIASMMLVSLVAGSLTGIPSNTSEAGNVTVTATQYAAAENKETAKTVSETKSSDEKTSDKKSSKESDEKSSSAKPTKEETVYAKIDGSGSVKSVTVSDQLKNISDKTKLDDISDLKDIVNVKGDEAFSAMGSKVVWDAGDEDICYQGTTTKELPVGIKISYKLDGKDISAADLKGKSGHVTIRYTYENKSGSKGEATTPFMMATGLLLDEGTFKNVTVENGKLMSDGERNMVIGYGLPAMKNILGVEDKDLDIPDYFEVEADVTDYEPVEGITIATNSIFNDLDTEEFDSLDELQDSMDELQDASSQLVSGSGELKNGIDTLLASSGSLTDGIDQLVTGGGALQSGANELANGGNALAEGNAKLADGTGKLLEGTKTLASGAGELNNGLKTAADQTQNVLLPGVQALDAGVSQMQGELTSQLPDLQDGVKALDEGAKKVQGGVTELQSGAAKVAAGTGDLSTGLGNLSGNIDDLSKVAAGLQEAYKALLTPQAGNSQDIDTASAQNAAQNISAQAQTLTQQLNAIQQSAYAAASTPAAYDNSQDTWSALNSIYGELGTLYNSVAESNPEAAAQISAIQYSLSNAMNSLGNGNVAAPNDAAAQVAVQAEEAIGTVQALSNNADEVVNDVAQISNQVEALDTTPQPSADSIEGAIAVLANGLATIQGKMPELTDGAEAVSKGATDLKSGADSLKSGVDTLANGTSTLSSGVNSMVSKVNDGVSQLKSGTSQLAAGVSGSNGLASGLNQLAAGAQKINEGSTELSEKMGEADAGAKSAAAGAAQLAAGANQLGDGAFTLKSGLDTLKSGSGALIDGVQQLDDGAAELNDGMIRFDKDGIQKLVDAFGGDTENLLDKMNEMLDASRAYKNFSGISDDMDGEVKFVFVTEE